MIEFNGGKIFGADYEFADGQARAEVGELKSAITRGNDRNILFDLIPD